MRPRKDCPTEPFTGRLALTMRCAASVKAGSKPPFAAKGANGQFGPSLLVKMAQQSEHAAADLMAGLSPECQSTLTGIAKTFGCVLLRFQ